MKLTPVQIKTLQFVLRDVASKAELDHRFSDGHAADDLVNLGLLHSHAGFYSITVKGRELAATIRKEVAIPAYKPEPVAYVAKAPERISINPTLNIVELSSPQSSVFKAAIETSNSTESGEPMNTVVEKSNTNAVHEKHTQKDVVDLVIQRNQINKSELYDLFPAVDIRGKKCIYIDLFNLKNKKALKEDEFGVIRVGEECNKFLAKSIKKAEVKTNSIPSYADTFKLVDTVDVLVKPAKYVDVDVPTFLRKDPIATVAEAPIPQVEDTLLAAETVESTSGSIASRVDEVLVFEYAAPAAAADTFELAREKTRQEIEKHLGTTVRFALTSDKTLMLMGLDQPVELSKSDTTKLIDFCEEIAMTLVCEVDTSEYDKHKAVLELCQSLMQFDPTELHAQIQAKSLDAAMKMQGLKG